MNPTGIGERGIDADIAQVARRNGEAQDLKATLAPEWNESMTREGILPRLRLLFGMRRFLLRCAVIGFFVATLIAFLIPNEYESSARLMPPDSQQGGGLALMAMLGGGQNGSSGLGSLATDLLGAKTTGAVFIAVMRSRTAEDSIIQRFELKKVYWTRTEESARKRLEKNTEITEERKSGVITVVVTDHDAKRAAARAGAYIEQLDILTAKLNTSAAHRERVFLESAWTELRLTWNQRKRISASSRARTRRSTSPPRAEPCWKAPRHCKAS